MPNVMVQNFYSDSLSKNKISFLKMNLKQKTTAREKQWFEVYYFLFVITQITAFFKVVHKPK